MRVLVTLIAFVFSTATFANPSVFGMEIGSTTETQLKSRYNVERTGVNKYTDGNMYSVPPSAIEFEGLQEVTVIFSDSGVLMGVLSTFPKSRFDYLKGVLDKKYERVSQEIPFVGNKAAAYRQDSTEIKLDAPHMSFTMSMHYLHDDLIRAFEQVSASERRQREQSEASQL